jgi:predicted phage terminase large subunit-like protein
MSDPTARLVDYVQKISPEYVPPYHLVDLCEEFERARLSLLWLSDDVVRTLDTEPIRHFKTETMLHGILWLMEWCPWARFVLMTYSHKRAQWLGKRLRDLARRTNVKPTKGWDTIDYWQNEEGGGVAVMSADMSTEGYDCHALFCDDPIDEHKSDVAEKREEVDRAIAYYTARCTRKGRPGPVLIVMSRFHPDDPIGRRQMRDGWKQIYHPAIIDLDGPDEKAFAPEILDLSELKRIRKEEFERDPTERVFWARFQGQPRTPGGDIFHEPMRYDAEAFPQWPGFRDVIGLDMAYSTAKIADWSAMVVLRIYEHKAYVREAVRVKLDPDMIRTTLMCLQSTYGASQIYSYVSGPEIGIVKELRRNGLRVTGLPARYNKLVRAQRTRAAWNSGNILLPDHAPWAPGMIATALDFRGLESDDDDLIDALVSACDGAMFRGTAKPTSLGSPRI